MELVKELSQKAMPLLSNDLMDSLMARLEAIGVNGVEDLNFVRIEDVDGILRPNQCRRLIQAFSGVQPARLDPTLTTLPQNDHQPQTPPETPGPMECSPPCEAYAVPWHKMPPNLMLALREKKRPKPKERRELVRILIDDVLCNSHIRPGRAKLREIAKQIVQQYPCSFQDRELSGTKIIGTGYDSLFIQLENRVDNVRRPLTVCSARRPIEEEDTVRKKPMQSDSYGCVAWRPVVEDTTELESKQDELKRAFHTNHLQESSVLKLMAETYCIQRATINKGTSINKIVDEWPFLFEAVHLFDHTEKLLGFPVQTRLSDELTRKEKAIKEFLDLKGIEMHEGPLPLVAGIAKFFKENPDHLLYQNEISRSPGVSIPCTPCILVMGDQLFKIAVDQEIVNDHISSPIVALAYAFALFYVLNIKYPKEMSLTLEFIQRVFLGINPERGSKAEMKGKKQPHIPPRLLKFLTELNNFENPWKI